MMSDRWLGEHPTLSAKTLCGILSATRCFASDDMMARIANSEQAVKCEVRHLRRVFANGGQYELAMRLKLRELREKNGWTQDEVASRSGMSKSYYSEIESGKKAANSRRIQRFAQVFGVPAFELIDDTSIEAELLAHLRTIQALDADDRRAVIRHALSLAGDAETRE